jgi:D-alanyl-D-alanine carboxypeptidase
MIDRRMLMASGLAFGATSALAVKPSSVAKRAAIEAIQLPTGFNGTFAYARNGRIEHARYVGMADVEAGKAISPDTQFKWGSASKWLASTTVLRLVEQKRLSLDAPITAYLPDFRHDTGEQVLLSRRCERRTLARPRWSRGLVMATCRSCQERGGITVR